MKIARPRVDKAATIRKMIELTFSDADDLNVPWSRTDEHCRYRTTETINDNEACVGSLAECTKGIENLPISCNRIKKIESVADVSISSIRKRTCPDWIANLPLSLRGIYEEQKKMWDRRKPALPCLGTSHLRDVVIQMHSRDGAIIKYLN